MGQPHTFLMDFGVTYGAAPHIYMDFKITYGAAPHILMDPQLHLWGRDEFAAPLMGQPHGLAAPHLWGRRQPRPPAPLMGQQKSPVAPVVGQRLNRSTAYGAEDPQVHLWGRG